MPSLLTPAVVSAHISATGPANVRVQDDVAAGSFLSVLLADAFGYSGTLTGISDSQGNSYALDSAVNQVDGDGSVYVAHGLIETALIAADSDELTLHWTGSFETAWVVATSFSGVGALDVAGMPNGTINPTPDASSPLSASIVPNVGDVLIAYATHERGPVLNDSAHGWSAFLDGVGSPDGANVIVGAWQRVTSDASVDYDTVNENNAILDPGPYDYYAASVICAYLSTSQPPGVMSAGAHLAGIVGS